MKLVCFNNIARNSKTETIDYLPIKVGEIYDIDTQNEKILRIKLGKHGFTFAKSSGSDWYWRLFFESTRDINLNQLGI